MQIQNVSEIITSLISLAVGFILGQIVAWHRTRIRGHSFVYPAPERSKRARYYVAALLVVMAVASVLQGAYFQHAQSRCNASFREAVVSRSQGSSGQFQALVELQEKLVMAPPGPRGETAKAEARQEYIDQAHALTEQRKANPYPDPEC